MRLFHLRMQIDRRCQVFVQELHGLSTNVLGRRVVGRLHGQISKVGAGDRQIWHDRAIIMRDNAHNDR